MSSPTSTTRATLADLAKVEGKAELIRGRIEHVPTGFLPAWIAGRIYRSLDDYAEQRAKGVALTDGMGYAVAELPSGRESFCPNVSYFTDPWPTSPMRFIEGAPEFAAEVRSESDYGPAAERQMAAKRDDYFAAGTQVVWDVDPQAQVIHVYRADNPIEPTTYRRGDEAEAEPAAPGWRVPVDQIFPALS